VTLYLFYSYSSSDERLKANIKVIDEPLRKLHKIRGVYYSWRKDVFTNSNYYNNDEEAIIQDDIPHTISPSPRFVGVIAQDVLPVLPELIRPYPFIQDDSRLLLNTNFVQNTSNDKSHSVESSKVSNSMDKFMSVKYQGFIPLIIEAIKELESITTDTSVIQDNADLYENKSLDSSSDDIYGDFCDCDEVALERDIRMLELRVVDIQREILSTLSAM
jgi:Chaperone of endosialidase